MQVGSQDRVDRRLAAILAADVAGYSRLMGEDEAGTLARLRTHRRELIDPKVAEHRGRIVKTTGDGILIEFPSVVEAVACSLAVQQAMTERNADIPEHQRIVFRVGINLGDVIVEDGDIHGDGVNVAARLEGIAEPGEVCVSAGVHDQVQGRLDCLFDDLGEQTLKNIARPVRVFRVRPGPAPTLNAVPLGPPALPLPDKPSIAVLPFQNMSGDIEQEYFADGMVEEIITALSRIRWLFVIARNSTFTYKGQPIDVKRVGRELGVRYVLEGSVRRGGNRVRITAQLIEAENGAHLWADRFDGAMEHVFDLQDQVATSVAGVVEPALQAAEIHRVSRRPTTDLTAYDLCLRAWHRVTSLESDGYYAALDLLGSAINRDPHYGPALSMSALCHSSLHIAGWSSDLEANRRDGLDLAGRALRVAGDDAGTIGRAAYVLGYFGQDLDAVIPLMERALTLNPSSADCWRWSGWLRLWAGQADVAIEHFETALRLNPRGADAAVSILYGIGVGHFFSKRFVEARAMLLRALQERPSWAPAYRFLAACHAHMGKLDDAREIIDQLRARTSIIIPWTVQWRNPADRELFLSGLHEALGPGTSRSRRKIGRHGGATEYP